jgi:hypothetical protein
MIAKTDIKVFQPMEWDDILHAFIPTYRLDGINFYPCISYSCKGEGRRASIIPGGSKYKRRGTKYYSSILKSVKT